MKGFGKLKELKQVLHKVSESSQSTAWLVIDRSRSSFWRMTLEASIHWKVFLIYIWTFYFLKCISWHKSRNWCKSADTATKSWTFFSVKWNDYHSWYYWWKCPRMVSSVWMFLRFSITQCCHSHFWGTS